MFNDSKKEYKDNCHKPKNGKEPYLIENIKIKLGKLSKEDRDTTRKGFLNM